MAATAEYKCLQCKSPFIARTADRKRGWAKYCSKSCKARRQERRTGQHAAYQARQEGHYYGEFPGAHRGGEFADAHLFSNEERDCNKD